MLTIIDPVLRLTALERRRKVRAVVCALAYAELRQHAVSTDLVQAVILTVHVIGLMQRGTFTWT